MCIYRLAGQGRFAVADLVLERGRTSQVVANPPSAS